MENFLGIRNISLLNPLVFLCCDTSLRLRLGKIISYTVDMPHTLKNLQRFFVPFNSHSLNLLIP